MDQSAKEAICAYHDELTAIRRDIHAHPELGLEVHRTAAKVAELLESYGIEVHRGIGGAGVVGVLRSGNGPGAVGLRADMDALPILEANDVPWKSGTAGVMHACGHDGHTTMLLGAARYLAATRNFSGTVNFIFQPGEEGAGGAEAMLADGLFQRFPCNTLYAMHNRPGQPVGWFGVTPGPAMSGGAFFDVTVRGKGGHGARPENAVDPLLAASQIVTALQSVVSRNVSPFDMAILSVTRFHAGEAYNVIPECAVIGGTVRAMKRQTMDLVEASLRRVTAGVAGGLGASAEVDFRVIFAPLVNDVDAARELADAAAEMVGENNVDRKKPPAPASEDFSFMLEKVPGAMINLGNGEASAPVHNHLYDFNDEILPIGATLFARIAERKLKRE
jgi:amidohydrolase